MNRDALRSAPAPSCRRAAFALMAVPPAPLWAAVPAVGEAVVSQPGLGQILQVAGGLAVVLVAIGAFALFGRRFKGLHGVGHKHLKIVDAVSVGARERIVLLEVGNEKVLLGLTPGRISPLHVCDRAAAGFSEAFEEAVGDVAREPGA